jgi:hypothetical protein
VPEMELDVLLQIESANESLLNHAQ